MFMSDFCSDQNKEGKIIFDLYLKLVFIIKADSNILCVCVCLSMITLYN